MSWDRATDDAFNRLLGYSQEELDRFHEKVDELRAWRKAHDPQSDFEWTESDSEPDGAPITPPDSPKGDSPDLSTKAWIKRKWADLSRGIEPCDSGFDNYETWKSYVLSENTGQILPASAPLQQSSIRKTRRRFVPAFSERQAQLECIIRFICADKTKQNNAIKDSCRLPIL